MVVFFSRDQNSLLNTCSSECVKIPPTHTNTYDCLWHWSSLQRLHILCPEAVLVNHFAVLLALSLCGWRGEYIHSFIVPALMRILSNKVGGGRRGGGFGRMFKDLFHSRLSKGKNAVRSCWCKGIVKNCVFVYSCAEQEAPLFSEKDCYGGVLKCWSDVFSLNLRFSFFSPAAGRTSSAFSIQWQTDWLRILMNHKDTTKGSFFLSFFPPHRVFSESTLRIH